MDIITRSIVVTLCMLVAGAPLALGRSLLHRGDAFEVYARQFAREYEPYMFAAFPLHAPVPVSVLRVVSRAPAAPPQPRAPLAAASSAHRVLYLPQYAEAARPLRDADPQDGRRYPQPTRHYARPYAPDQEYEASSYEYPRPIYDRKPHRQAASPAPAYEYSAEEYGPYAAQQAALPQLTYALAPYEEHAAQEAAPAVLFARPSPSGGYTYRRVPIATPPTKKKASALKEKEKDPPFIVKIHKYRIVRDDLI